jgi:hypothetical protein
MEVDRRSGALVVARTYKTLSLSLPPGIVEELVAIGKPTGRTGARVAAEIVLREIAKLPDPKEETRRTSWCCTARVIPVHGPFVSPETPLGDRLWVPVIVLLCGACKKQMHGREYEGWIADA